MLSNALSSYSSGHSNMERPDAHGTDSVCADGCEEESVLTHSLLPFTLKAFPLHSVLLNDCYVDTRQLAFSMVSF